MFYLYLFFKNYIKNIPRDTEFKPLDPRSIIILEKVSKPCQQDLKTDNSLETRGINLDKRVNE